MNELYEAIARITGTKARASHGSAKIGEQTRSVLDGSKLRSVADVAAVRPLAEGLKQTVGSFRKR